MSQMDNVNKVAFHTSYKNIVHIPVTPLNMNMNGKLAFFFAAGSCAMLQRVLVVVNSCVG